METQEKPKRQLTEAQRLAFLKAREKRMVNLEKKRQEEIAETKDSSTDEVIDDIKVDDESKQVQDEVTDVQPAKKPRKKYVRKSKSIPEVSESEEKTENIETVEDQTDDINAEDKNEDNEHTEPLQKEIVVDHDLLADRIVERISKLDPPVLKRESAVRQRQPKQRLHAPTPPQVNFNWM